MVHGEAPGGPHGGAHGDTHGGAHGESSAHSSAHGEAVHYSYCVETEEVHESHGIHVASWRWTEVQTYYAITLFIVIAALAKLGKEQDD